MEPVDDESPAALDFQLLFSGLPTAYLVMTPDLVIVEANTAYLTLLGRCRDDLIGRPVFEAFPPTPDALDDQGRNPLQLSFERARDTGELDAMPLYRYGVSDPVTGQVVERFWSLISAPLIDADGTTVMIVQRVEDVSDYVREREGLRQDAERGLAMEADLYLRMQQLRVAQEAREVAARRLTSLGEVALQLTGAESVDDLERIVVSQGLQVLGADGGALVSRDDATGGWRVTVSAALGEGARSMFSQMPFESPLPGCATARSGRPLQLPTIASGLAFHPSMASVYEATGRSGWAFVPLGVRDERLGSLAVSWVEEHTLAPDELDLLDGFAAQCAQALDRLLVLQGERRAAAAVARMSESLQRSLLTDPPELDGIQVAVRYAPAAHHAQVGGDWYDAFTTRDGTTTLVIGDVSGHDREAAAAMGALRNLLRGIAYALGEPPASALSMLDQAAGELDVGALATVVLAQVVRSQSSPGAEPGLTLRWSNAGHPPPLLIGTDGSARLLETAPDLLLGLDVGTHRADHERLLEPGWTVLLYTDGLVERRGLHLEAGLAWLVQAVGPLAALPLEDLCDALLAQLPAAVEDDVALLAVRAAGRAGGG